MPPIWHWQGSKESVANHILIAHFFRLLSIHGLRPPGEQFGERLNRSGKIPKNMKGFGNDEVKEGRGGLCDSEERRREWLRCQGGGTVRGAGWFTLRAETWLRNNRSWMNGIKGRFREEGRWEMHRMMEQECQEECAALHLSTCSAWFFPSSCAAAPPPPFSHTLSHFPAWEEQLCSSSSHFELYRSVGVGLYAAILWQLYSLSSFLVKQTRRRFS